MAAERPVQPIIGEAPVFLEMLEHVSRAAPLSKPVLVVGERGTGKELIASRLHFLSRRWEQPLIKVNCAALTESILESELFGHEAGAFTGAARTHVGHFERADNGTLVLDELATISLRMQEKILRVIEYGELQRVGGSETISIDVRIVGATNADLQALAAKGRFRVDLIDRMAFDVITVPPLRERMEDILPLAYAFAINMISELQLQVFPGFAARASSLLLHHDWPGNVRELKNAVERSVYRATDPDQLITQIAFDPFDSPFRIRAPQHARGDQHADTGAQRLQVLPTDLKRRLYELEQELLKAALEKSRFNQRVAANLLGLSYHQLRGKIRKHALDLKNG
jgi:psp operon transcriptional activator